MCADYAFTCVPCLVAFPDRDELKAHLLSEWHRYNLKRRLAELQPISAAEYARKIQLVEAHGPPVKGSATAKVRSRKKEEGRRSRQKHVEATTLLVNRPAQVVPVIRPAESLESEEAKSQSTTKFETVKEFDVRFSLFDTHVADSMDANMEYMSKYHSLYLHDREYLKDLEGFLTYLGRKVFEGHQCLYCNRPFKSVEAVRRHMVDRGHKRIGTHLAEHQEEYEPFYDYTESYKELNLPAHVVAKLPALMGPKPVEPETNEEEEWEVVEEYYEDEVEEGLILPGRPTNAEMTWQETLEAIGFRQAHLNEEGNLILPNDHEIVSRKNLKPGMKIALMKPRPRRVHLPAITEGAENATDAREIVQSRAKFVRVKQDSEMRLGVKSNRLYRYIARKNKIFI